MYRTIKTLAPVILVIFMATSIISPAFGTDEPQKNSEKIEDVQISMSLYSYDIDTKTTGPAIEKPQIGQPFLMDLKVQGKGSQVTDVTLLQDTFQYIDSYDEQDASPWVHRKAFILQAPDTPGSYTCTFKCTDKFGNSALVYTTIGVDQLHQAPPAGTEITPGPMQEPVPQEPVQGTINPAPSNEPAAQNPPNEPVVQNPPSQTVTSEAVVIVPVTPVKTTIQPTKEVVIFKVTPVKKVKKVPPPAKKTPARSTTYTTTYTTTTRAYYYSQPMRMIMLGDWGSFWWGFWIGVVVTAVIVGSAK